MAGKSPGSKSECHRETPEKIFLEALGVINSCVKPSFLGKVFRAHWKLINSWSGTRTGEKRFTIVYPQKVKQVMSNTRFNML